jgi:hypothetical protein
VSVLQRPPLRQWLYRRSDPRHSQETTPPAGSTSCSPRPRRVSAKATLNAYESCWKNHIRPVFGHLAARRDRRADDPPVHDGEARHGLEAQHRE